MAKSTNNITHTHISISNHTVIRVLLLITLFGLSIQFFRTTMPIWVLLIVSFFLALALNPSVSYLAKRLPKRSRALATALAYIMVLGALSLLIFSIAPPMVKQTQELVSDLPGYIEQLKTSDNSAAQWLKRSGITNELEVSREQIIDGVASAGTPVLNVIKRVFTSIAATLTVLVLTFLMLVEGPRWLNKLLSLQPAEKAKHRQDMAMRMYRVVSSYVSGQLLIAFLLAVFSFIMLTAVGLPYALPLASIVGLFGLVPLIGNPAGALILVTVGLINSLSTGIILLVAFTIYQQFENYVLQPRIQARKVEISPLTVIIAVLFGANLSGLLGALLAIPVAACLRILVNDYIDSRHAAGKTRLI